MRQFIDVEDLEDWLDTLSYEEFWAQIDPFDLDRDYRDYCDREIARGVRAETVLICLKSEARFVLMDEQGLKYRELVEEMSLH